MPEHDSTKTNQADLRELVTKSSEDNRVSKRMALSQSVSAVVRRSGCSTYSIAAKAASTSGEARVSNLSPSSSTMACLQAPVCMHACLLSERAQQGPARRDVSRF